MKNTVSIILMSLFFFICSCGDKYGAINSKIEKQGAENATFTNQEYSDMLEYVTAGMGDLMTLPDSEIDKKYPYMPSFIDALGYAYDRDELPSAMANKFENLAIALLERGLSIADSSESGKNERWEAYNERIYDEENDWDEDNDYGDSNNNNGQMTGNDIAKRGSITLHGRLYNKATTIRLTFVPQNGKWQVEGSLMYDGISTEPSYLTGSFDGESLRLTEIEGVDEVGTYKGSLSGYNGQITYQGKTYSEGESASFSFTGN